VLVLHALEHLTPAEIAKLIGIDAVTVRWHLSRGRRELARELERLDGATPGRHYERCCTRLIPCVLNPPGPHPNVIACAGGCWRQSLP